MHNLSISELNQLVSIDTFNSSSLFAISIIDLSTYELVYANETMKLILADVNAKNCWKAKYDLDSPCMWCKAQELIMISNRNANQHLSNDNNSYATYEHFNEIANKWYQIQVKLSTLENGNQYLISFALDISMQKEAQSQLINSHVQLQQKTVSLEKARQQLKKLANQDPLTNLYNRRYFQDISQKLVNIAKRDGSDLTVIMLDIDKFKNINDSYGHSTGDEVIINLANLLIEKTRESDIVARFGGEEFAVLLPSTDKEGAYKTADTIREVVEKQVLKVDKNISIQYTISLGVDYYDITTDNKIDDALNRADKALYQAKNSGRNRVAINC
ncbi:MAG: GGDEF domain-containing protein [gamma proteobacterium symbiont of Taylorina sp.]|nr:GGDEF domain-containing protein [gamma proteobacterium symbiont of Taylorina sp.]